MMKLDRLQISAAKFFVWIRLECYAELKIFSQYPVHRNGLIMNRRRWMPRPLEDLTMKDSSLKNFPTMVLLNRFVFSWAMIFACLLLLGDPGDCYAGGGPENLVLVVNGDSAASKLIANHYIHARQIPARNVIYLNGLPERQIASLKVFKEQIIKPILQQMQERKIGEGIDYIVYSAGFPTTIDAREHANLLAEQVSTAMGSERGFQKQLYHGQGSLNAMTYFAGAVIGDQPGYMTLDSNTYYRRRASAILKRPFVGARKKEFDEATEAFDSEGAELDQAIKTLEGLAKANPEQVAVIYWLARFYARKGNANQAVRWLTQAVRNGWKYRTQTKSDLAFSKISDDPLFNGIVERMPDQPFDFVMTRGFKSKRAWAPNGMLNREPGQGNRFFLSTVLAITRNYGTTEKEALRQLKISMRADETHPTGTFYFSDTKDVRNTTRFPNYTLAIDALERLGHEGVVITQPLPNQKRDVLGLTTGTPNFNWTGSGSKFLPGAIGDNLTSYGGKMDISSQTKLSEFIRNGAAGASGAVVEPYAIQAKFPHPMIHAHYAAGCSLAESFYQSIQGSHQMLIVGDALCQPYATRPVLALSGVDNGGDLKGVADLLVDGSQSPVPIAGIETYVDGVLVNRARLEDGKRKIKLDTTGMSDGFHEIRVVAVANNAIETTGNQIVAVSINNSGFKTELSTDQVDFLDTDELVFTAKSNFGDSIELMHNMRSIAKRIGREVEFRIPATLLGRGPVTLEAIALDTDGGGVTSMPIKFEIEGRLSIRKEMTEQKKSTSKRSKEPAESASEARN